MKKKINGHFAGFFRNIDNIRGKSIYLSFQNSTILNRTFVFSPEFISPVLLIPQCAIFIAKFIRTQCRKIYRKILNITQSGSLDMRNYIFSFTLFKNKYVKSTTLTNGALNI